jgi:hypothetical protein
VPPQTLKKGDVVMIDGGTSCDHRFESRMDEHTRKSAHFSTVNALRSRTVQGRSRKSGDAG